MIFPDDYELIVNNKIQVFILNIFVFLTEFIFLSLDIN